MARYHSRLIRGDLIQGGVQIDCFKNLFWEGDGKGAGSGGKEEEGERMMKKRILFYFLFFICLSGFIAGCVPEKYRSSSGLLTGGDSRFPIRVAVLPFSTPYDKPEAINLVATKLFSEGLVKLDFHVVDSKPIEEILDKKKYDSIRRATGRNERYSLEQFKFEFRSEHFRKTLSEMLSLDGIFVGSIDLDPLSPGKEEGKWGWAYIQVDLFHIQTGKVIWSYSDEYGHLFPKKWKNSVTLVTNKALSYLEEDLNAAKEKMKEKAR
jgi:hypothetical protein